MTGDLGLALLFPEAGCLLVLLAVLAADLFLPPDRKKVLGPATLAGLALLVLVSAFFSHLRGTALHGMYRLDTFALLFKILFIALAMGVISMAGEFLKTLQNPGEFYLLTLAALLGMLFLASANDLLLLFISLELVTVSFYILTAYVKTDARSVEAAAKYLILGSLASALFLYGASYVYGTLGSTQFDSLRYSLTSARPAGPAVIFGFLLVLAGLAFKAGSVPFQLWIPDVYEGAPVPVTAFLAAGSKTAAFAVLLRVFYLLLEPAAWSWSLLFSVLAALTLLYGNLGAIPQKNIKRLLGYSSIGHAGYLLTGLAAGGPSGGEAVVFYLAAYGVTTLAAFLVVVLCSIRLGSDSLEAYDGLAQRSPVLAASLFLALLSLAGVPPLAGFFAKFLILSSAVERGLVWLALLGAANVVISLYYYLALVRRMYIESPRNPALLAVPLVHRLTLYGMLTAILGMGILHGPFVDLARAAMQDLLR